MAYWWEKFFDEEYIRLWGQRPPEDTAREADGLWQLLRLKEGSRVLDAPCGYGRLAQMLAARGATVVGVDLSKVLLAHAEKDRGALPADRLRYFRHDLRQPLPANGFDAAYNVFTSIGYGTEDDDLAIFKTLRDAVRPGGLVFVETMHRDLVAASRSHGGPPGNRYADGTLVVEETVFDPIAGRLEMRWYWSGPKGRGEKSGSLRLYSATELVRLLDQSGLRFVSAHKGCSTEPFRSDGPEMGGRLGILTQRPESSS